MAQPNEKLPFSLHALVKQTAQLIRNEIKTPSKKKRKISKETDLSNTNKIEQIARMLRKQAHKYSQRKKKSS